MTSRKMAAQTQVVSPVTIASITVAAVRWPGSSAQAVCAVAFPRKVTALSSRKIQSFTMKPFARRSRWLPSPLRGSRAGSDRNDGKGWGTFFQIGAKGYTDLVRCPTVSG